MLSALKRIVNNNNNNGNNGSNNNAKNQPTDQLQQGQQQTQKTNGMQSISQNLQKKFSKGVNYNMKIIIRGDCNTGKTCLWLRLQGQQFKESYEPSDEIKAANINWNYKLGDTDIVKVEIWDVVDKSKKKHQLLTNNRLKLDNSELKTQIPIEASLDAEFIDVYKNCNGCILVFDITKQWTWDYIERELPKIPSHIPVLVLGNHKDMHHHRTIEEMKCKYFIETLNRGSMGSVVRYAETSMRNGFGLTYIYKFLNIPFLLLQRETLMQQLEINAKEMDTVNEELCIIESNESVNYDTFISNLNNKRRTQSEQLASNVLKNAKTIEEAKKEALEREEAEKAKQLSQQSDGKKLINNILQKITVPTVSTNSSDKHNDSNKNSNNKQTTLQKPSLQNKTTTPNILESILPDTVDEFNRFLDDSKVNDNVTKIQLDQSQRNNYDSDNDDNNVNPMVLNYCENIELSEEESNSKINNNTSLNNRFKNSKYESSDDEKNDILLKPNVNSNVKNKSPTNLNKIENDFVLINKKDNDGLSSASSMYSSKDDNEKSKNLFESKVTTNLNSAINIKLNNDDFEFFEKLGNNNNRNSSSSVNSSSLTRNNQNQLSTHQEIENDSLIKGTENLEIEDKKSKKKKKHSKSSKKQSNDDDDDDYDNINDKKSSKKSKSKKSSKEKKHKNNDNEDDDDDENEGTRIHVKADADYEEI